MNVKSRCQNRNIHYVYTRLNISPIDASYLAQNEHHDGHIQYRAPYPDEPDYEFLPQSLTTYTELYYILAISPSRLYYYISNRYYDLG